MNQVAAEVTKNNRVLENIFRTHRRKLTSSHIIWLRCPEIARESRPGQFVMVSCGEECRLPRPFSIHQINDRGGMALFFGVWQDGRGTHWLSQRQASDKIDLLGPLGNGFSTHSASHNLLLVAGGIGIAPLYSLAQDALSKGCTVTLLSGASTASQLYPSHLLPPEIKLITATEDGTGGEKGLITDLLPDYVHWADQIFACGPMLMYRVMSTQHIVQDKPIQISLEVRMGCGLGVCYGCTVKTKSGLKQVCKDGPVFELDDILWDELASEY